ncbi:MAG: trigger factor [Cyclobacteriaceae bacterium]|nr:trigger factor [Cyclobacteriaceae bacterium]
MDIQLEKNSSTEALIKIKLKETDYQPKLKEKLKSYSKKANIKGFRPGKVPISLIEKMYGKSILVEEINKILVDSLKDYIKKNDIKIIGDPLPNNEKAKEIDWDEQKEFDFEYNIGLIDDFEYKLEFKINKYQIKLDKKTIDEAIDELKVRYGKMTNPEISVEGDSIFGTLSQLGTEFTKDGLIEISKVSKKFRKSFIGIKKEDVVKVDIKKLFNDDKDLVEVTGLSDDEIKTLTGEFEITVKNVNRIEPAEMNQEFFDKIFGEGKVKTEEEFIEEYSKIFEENYDRESEYLLAHQIQEKVLKETKLDIPQDFYKKWILATNEGIKEEDLEKDFEDYIKDLKWTLLKNRIADDNELKIEYADVVESTKKMYEAQFGGIELTEEMDKSMDALVNNYLQQENGKNYMNVFDQLRTEKILDILKQKAEISVKKVTREEFNKKAEK